MSEASRTSRLPTAATRIQSPDSGVGHLGLNTAGIAGGVGGAHLDASVVVGESVEFTPEHGAWDCEPIGAALAVEMAGQG